MSTHAHLKSVYPWSRRSNSTVKWASSTTARPVFVSLLDCPQCSSCPCGFATYCTISHAVHGYILISLFLSTKFAFFYRLQKFSLQCATLPEGHPQFFFVCKLLGTCPGPFALQSADPARNGQIQSREKRQKHSVSKARTMNELNKQIRKQISLRGRVSQRRKDHSGVKSSIDGALEVEESAPSSHWVRDTCDKSAHPIQRKEAPMTEVSQWSQKAGRNVRWNTRNQVFDGVPESWSASNSTNPGLVTAWKRNMQETCNKRAT